MNNNIKIEDIKSEPLTTGQKEFLVSGLFNMISKENIQFVSKEKYDNLQSKIDKAIEYVSSLSSKGKDCEIYYDIKKEILDILKEDK